MDNDASIATCQNNTRGTWLVEIIPLPESLVLERVHITHFLCYIFRNKERGKEILPRSIYI